MADSNRMRHQQPAAMESPATRQRRELIATFERLAAVGRELLQLADDCDAYAAGSEDPAYEAYRRNPYWDPRD